MTDSLTSKCGHETPHKRDPKKVVVSKEGWSLTRDCLRASCYKYLLSFQFLVQKVIGVAQDALRCSLTEVKFSLETHTVFQNKSLKPLWAFVTIAQSHETTEKEQQQEKWQKWKCVNYNKYNQKPAYQVWSHTGSTIQKIIIIIIIIYPLTARVAGAPQMILQPVFSIFPCSPLPSGTCRTPGLSIHWCCLPTSSSVCLVFFPLFTVPCKMVFGQTWWTGDTIIPLHFASLHNGKEVFV